MESRTFFGRDYVIFTTDLPTAGPSPDHFEHGRLNECETEDSVGISLRAIRLIARAIDGLTRAGANFVRRFGSTCGGPFGNARRFPGDEMIVRMDEMLRLSGK